MALIDLSKVKATAGVSDAGVQLSFGTYLPNIDPRAFRLYARVIHDDDRFDPKVRPMDLQLALSDATLGLWTVTARLERNLQNNFGKPGRYLYRYQLRNAAEEVVVNWFTDPFAGTTDDVGELSAVDTNPPDVEFKWSDDTWRVPELDELVVYELHVEEFNDGFSGVQRRLEYLESLGVNCLELMPVTSLKLDFDWGYGPLHYFAPNERWGGRLGLKQLVDTCHARQMAVILDVVYQHTDCDFPYHLVYKVAGVSSPMIDGKGDYGPKIDYSLPFAQEYVANVNRHWLQEYHVDGFRYDEVTDLYQSPTDTGYAKLVYDTYGASLAIPRFQGADPMLPGYSRIIQCAEALGKAREVLGKTYTNCAWTDDLLNVAEAAAAKGLPDEDLPHTLDPYFSQYPASNWVKDASGQAVEMPVAPFQYLESHDHDPLIAYIRGTTVGEVFACRARWFKLQPYVIALYTCQGIPMLWQGQEFGDDSVLAPGGDLRVHFRRDVHWEHFYDDIGGALIRLHRILGGLRRSIPALRSRQSYYFYQQSQPAAGLLAFRRGHPNGQVAIVVLNFSDAAGTIDVPLPRKGCYVERVDADARLGPYVISAEADGDLVAVTVPSNYGWLFTGPTEAETAVLAPGS